MGCYGKHSYASTSRAIHKRLHNLNRTKLNISNKQLPAIGLGFRRAKKRLAQSCREPDRWQLLAGLIHRFHSSYSGIALTLSLGNTQTVAAQVHDGLADIGFIEGDIDDPMLTARSVAEDNLVLIAAASHPWAIEPPSDAKDFAIARWICRERGSGTRSVLEGALPALGMRQDDLRIALELPSNEAVCAAVEAGAGVTIISRLVVDRALKARSLFAINVDLPKRNFSILRHKERYITQASAAFHDLATSWADSTTNRCLHRASTSSPEG